MRDPDPRLVALGRALRRARRSRDLSQEAIGQRAGMHPNHVGTIERGTSTDHQLPASGFGFAGDFGYGLIGVFEHFPQHEDDALFWL